MNGIAFGNLNIPKISIGDTPIVKVSRGDTLVWPAGGVPINFVNKIQQTTSTASGTPCAWPSSAAVGDVIIFIERITQDGTGTNPVTAYPLGFTPIHPSLESLAKTRFCTSYRIVTEQDVIDQTPIQGMAQVPTSGTVKYAILWRGYDDGLQAADITSVEVLELGLEGTALNPAPQVMSNSTPKQLLNLAVYSGLSVNPRTWTGQSWTEELNVNTSFYIKYLTSPVADSPITVDMPDNSNDNILASMTLNFNNTP